MAGDVALIDGLKLAAHGAQSPTALALACVVMFARIAPAMWLTPFLGTSLVPRTVRTGLTVALGILLLPALAPSLPNLVAGGNVLLLAVLLKELTIGVAIAFIAGLIFYAAQSAGWLADTARGANMGEVMVPQAGKRSTAMGSLLFQLTLVVFFALGGHRLYVLALAHSFERLPLGAFPTSTGLLGFARLASELSAQVFVLALSWAAPVVATAIVVDLALGWVNRFAPQVNSFFLAMPLKAALGVVFLSLITGAFVLLLPQALEAMVGHVQQAIAWLAR